MAARLADAGFTLGSIINAIRISSQFIDEIATGGSAVGRAFFVSSTSIVTKIVGGGLAAFGIVFGIYGIVSGTVELNKETPT